MTADLTPRERVARAMYETGWSARRGMVTWESSPWHVREDDLTRADAALTALADHPGLAEVLGNTLRAHQPTTGMSVASGVTCRCGYWNGNEVGGKTRPVGYQGLQWHQANVLADVVRAWLRGA